jgi:DNA mismatch endonuclease, patch repair protein
MGKALLEVTDHVDALKRSQMMAAVRSKDTKPEMAVRRLVHAMGFRYRLHQTSLPGKPDLVFASRRKIILVHGCFWHRHRGCRYATTPKTRTAFWNQKFCTNIERDRRTLRELKRMGWSVKTVWQCELKNPAKLAKALDEFLSN